MSNRSLTLLSRSALLAIAVSAAPVVHADFLSAAKDPFFGNSVGIDLQVAPGTLVPIAGVGPGGATLYASDFFINNFDIVSGSGAQNIYSADFTVNFLLADGSATGSSATLHTDAFTVDFSSNHTTQFQSGTFDLTLEAATFNSLPGDPLLQVSLVQASHATVVIGTHVTGGYNIHYTSPFVIQGQYSLNNGASNTPTPPLGDSNGGGVTANAPEPAVLGLAIPGLLVMAGLRKRRRPLLVAAA